MANFSVNLDTESGITFIEFTGSISISEVAVFMQSPQYQNRTNKVIYDCRKASFGEIPSDDVLLGVRKLKPASKPGNRGAYVCAEGVDFGIANMFKHYSQVSEYPEPIEIFTSMEEAVRWISDG